MRTQKKEAVEINKLVKLIPPGKQFKEDLKGFFDLRLESLAHLSEEQKKNNKPLVDSYTKDYARLMEILGDNGEGRTLLFNIDSISAQMTSVDEQHYYETGFADGVNFIIAMQKSRKALGA